MREDALVTTPARPCLAPLRLRLSKVVVVGDLYVGKTSLIHRCVASHPLPARLSGLPGRPSPRSQQRPCGCWEGMQEIRETADVQRVWPPRSLAMVRRSPLPPLLVGTGPLPVLTPTCGLWLRQPLPMELSLEAPSACGLSPWPGSMATATWPPRAGGLPVACSPTRGL